MDSELVDQLRILLDQVNGVRSFHTHRTLRSRIIDILRDFRGETPYPYTMADEVVLSINVIMHRLDLKVLCPNSSQLGTLKFTNAKFHIEINQGEVSFSSDKFPLLQLVDANGLRFDSEHPIDVEHVRANMRTLFNASGKTMEEVGVAMGIAKGSAKAFVSRLLSSSANRDPQLSTVLAFAKAIGCPPSAVFAVS